MILRANLTVAVLLGIDRNQLDNARFRKWIVPEDLETWEQYFANLLRSEEKLRHVIVLRRGDGSPFPCQAGKYPVHRCWRWTNQESGWQSATFRISGLPKRRHARARICFRLAEEAKIASEIPYRRLFETAQDGILILDAETGQIVDVNPFLIDMLGFSRDQFLGKKIWEIGLFKDIVANKDNFEELQRKEYIRYEDLPLETADGRRIAVEFVSNVYTVNNTKVIQCNIRDITERKRAEEAQVASEIRYRRLFETAQDGILILDADTGQIVEVNPFLIDMLGFSRDQFLGKKLWEIGLFKDIVANKDNFEELQRKEYIRYEDLPLETADGRRIAVEFVSNVYTVNNKKVIQCNIRDNTERKRAEEAQVASEIRYRRLFETAQDGILILDAETGQIVEVNPFLINMLGFSRDQFLGKKLWEIGLFKDIVANKENFEELQRKEYIRYEDMPLETADGQRIAVEFVSNVYTVNNKKVIQCNIRNNTERKRAEEAQVASEIRYRRLFETAQDGILILDADTGQIVEVNPFLIHMLGFSRDQFLGKKIWEIGLFKDIVANKDNFEELQRQGICPVRRYAARNR